MGNIKYERPKTINFKMGIGGRCYDFADVIEKHLNIRLKEETKLLINCCRKQSSEEYIDWFNHTEKHNSALITKEVGRLNKGRSVPIDFYSDEGKFLIGKSLLDKFVMTKRNEVIDLRKALGLEYRKYSNKNIILTNGIERSDIFRLFGSPLVLEDLKNNYKTLAKQCHPDAGGTENLMSRVSGLYKKLAEGWDKYDPTHLGISPEDLANVMNARFEESEMIMLLDFWPGLA